MDIPDKNKAPLDWLLKEEDNRIKYLQGIVDSAIFRIMNVPMTRQDALNLVLKVRARACELFPDAAETFDLIYMKRFERVINEFTRNEPR